MIRSTAFVTTITAAWKSCVYSCAPTTAQRTENERPLPARRSLMLNPELFRGETPCHERFRELSALAAIGQLSSAENAELSAHLRECADCREAHVGYANVVQRQL